MSSKADIRDAKAKRAALKQYAKAHDRHDEAEQFLRTFGLHTHATVRHGAALIALEGWRAENECPKELA